MNRATRILYRAGLIALAIAGTLATPGAGQTENRPRRGRETRKVVSPSASFVVYAPAGWLVSERTARQYRTVSITDAARQCRAVMSHGRRPADQDIWSVAGRIMYDLRRRYPGITFSRVMRSPKGDRAVFDGRHERGRGGPRKLRYWVTLHGSDFVCSGIEAPADRFTAQRLVLLSILSNVRVLKGAWSTGGQPPRPESLVRHRLRDGSASFRMPRGWKVHEFGKTSFWATDPSGTVSFIKAGVKAYTPKIGIRPRGKIISPFLAPHRAQKLFMERQKLLFDTRFEKVIPMHELARAMRQVYTLGDIRAEWYIYTARDREGRRIRACTLGVGFYNRFGYEWALEHITVAAPADRFEVMAPTLAAMFQSYATDQRWLAKYMQQGAARVRKMAAKTSRMIRRNADAIHKMMNEAYEERNRSLDYIDYQRTSYIRGTQDWVSAVEGGTVYHTDTWGTKNTVTGEFWEAGEGRPYDYVRFTGRNPKYDEMMTSVNDRATWERHIANRW